MAYVGLASSKLDKQNQDPFSEPKESHTDNLDTVGDSTETALISFYNGDVKELVICVEDKLATAVTVKVYGSNDETLHSTDPLANNTLHLLDTMSLTGSDTDYYVVADNWKWVVLTETDADVGGNDDVLKVDTHANSRGG